MGVGREEFGVLVINIANPVAAINGFSNNTVDLDHVVVSRLLDEAIGVTPEKPPYSFIS